MNGPRLQPPFGVPTLTEVVEPRFSPPQFSEPAEPQEVQAPAAPAPANEPLMVGPAVDAPVFDEGQLIERVLADLQRQVELMLEYRLREVLTPALQRATDALVRDARVELASTLRDVVARAVAQELLRHRGR